MNTKELAKIVKDYRERSGLSQGELADKLDFTQATISRIESGKQSPRIEQLEKLLELIQRTDLLPTMNEDRHSQFAELNFQENYVQFGKSDWNCFWVNRQIENVGGDVVLVKELRKNQQLGILVGDSVGHGKASAYMSFALEFAYSTIATMMSPSILSTEFFDRAFSLGIAKTGENWRGEPSMGIGQIDLINGTLSYINRGMPYPVLIEGDKASYITDKRESAFNLDQPVFAEGSIVKKLNQGQSLFLYTDGLLDLVQEKELTSTLMKINRLFKGDSKALGKSLIRILQKNNSEKSVLDDVSFLIISRTKKRKSNGV